MFRETMRKKHETRLQHVYEKEKRNILPLNNREIFILGIGLYWGEGVKLYNATLSISNTDPSIIKFFIIWLNRSFGVSKDKLKVHLQIV